MMNSTVAWHLNDFLVATKDEIVGDFEPEAVCEVLGSFESLPDDWKFNVGNETCLALENMAACARRVESHMIGCAKALVLQCVDSYLKEFRLAQELLEAAMEEFTTAYQNAVALIERELAGLSADELLDALGVVIEDAPKDVEIARALVYMCHRHYQEVSEFADRGIDNETLVDCRRELVVAARRRYRDAQSVLLDVIRKKMELQGEERV